MLHLPETASFLAECAATDTDRASIRSQRERLASEDLLIHNEPLLSFYPGSFATPLIISIPHSGTSWPNSLGAAPNTNFARNSDEAVDQLYCGFTECGAAVIRAEMSRLVVDLNRAPDDIDPRLVPEHPSAAPRALAQPILELGNRLGSSLEPRGVVWSHALPKLRLFRQLTLDAFERRLDRYYLPYYRALGRLITRRIATFGYAIILDAHSMPPIIPASIVVGTRGGTALDSTLLRALRAALAPGPILGPIDDLVSLSAATVARAVTFDEPYAGGHIVEYFGQPNLGVHAVQIETNRALYLHGPRDAHGNLRLAPPTPGSLREAGDLLRQHIIATLLATRPQSHFG